MTSPLEVRSFRSVFALERRIYRVDTLRLNPTGIPLRGIVYAGALVLAALAAGALPPTAWLDPLIPWYVRDLGVPLSAATLLGALRIDGRPFHIAALALLEHRLARRRLDGLAPLPFRAGCWHPQPVLCIPDGSDPRFRTAALPRTGRRVGAPPSFARGMASAGTGRHHDSPTRRCVREPGGARTGARRGP